MNEENKNLLEKYPFLKLRSVWTSEMLDDESESDDETWLDALEEGWKIRFGIPFIEDLNEVLTKNNCVNDYQIIQVKEKWGQLRWYDYGAPEEWDDHMNAWEYISEHTCKKCGKFPVPMRDDGWISPWCDECFGSWRKVPYTDEEKEKYTCPEFDTNRLLEYLTIRKWNKDFTESYYIDLKPYYKKIGFTDFSNLITREEMAQYDDYVEALNKFKKINNLHYIKDSEIIPLEIQHMSPFKK